MVDSGVNAFRINMSHGTYQEKKALFDQIKKINNGRLADKVIVCSGSMSAVEGSFKYIDKKGKHSWKNWKISTSNRVL